MLEAEPAFGFIELHRRDAKVHQNPVNRRPPHRAEHLGERPVVGMHQRHAIPKPGESFTRDGQRRFVPINPHHVPGSRVQEGLGMPPEPQRAVHVPPVGLRRQVRNDVGEKNGLVRRRQMPCSASARASSSVNGSLVSRASSRS